MSPKPRWHRALLLLVLLLPPVPAGAQRAARPAPPPPIRSAPVSNLRYDVTFDSTTAAERTIKVAVSFDVTGGRLTLHVQELSDRARMPIGSLVPACAGMVVWLDRGQAEAAAKAAVEHLQEMEGDPAGVLIASRPEAAGLADRLAALNRRWTVTPHAPRSLLAVLRLLQGKA